MIKWTGKGQNKIIPQSKFLKAFMKQKLKCYFFDFSIFLQENIRLSLRIKEEHVESLINANFYTSVHQIELAAI